MAMKVSRFPDISTQRFRAAAMRLWKYSRNGHRIQLEIKSFYLPAIYFSQFYVSSMGICRS
jgi:hypothetical protein